MKATKFTRETIRNIGVPAKEMPKIAVGDIVVISQRIVEGDKERSQLFEGDIIAIRNHGASSMFTVRKIGADSVPVERIFPLYSPLLESIKVVRKGQVRRAKLYFMRKRIGKAARLQEVLMTREQREQQQGAQHSTPSHKATSMKAKAPAQSL